MRLIAFLNMVPNMLLVEGSSGFLIHHVNTLLWKNQNEMNMVKKSESILHGTEKGDLSHEQICPLPQEFPLLFLLKSFTFHMQVLLLFPS